MPSNPVDDALKCATPQQQLENQAAFDRARTQIDIKTMKEVDEIGAPTPKLAAPDPTGAALTRLNPDFRDKIESIQQGGINYYDAPKAQEDVVLPSESIMSEAPLEMTEPDVMENTGPIIDDMIIP